MRKLLEVRAIQYLPVVSAAGLSDQLFVERCAVAAGRDDFVLPCSLGSRNDARLPSRLKSMSPANFTDSWDQGLKQVLARLGALGVEPQLDQDRGRQIALRDYLPTRVTIAKPEPVFANVFPLRLPQTMLLYDLRRSLTEAEVLELRSCWAFVELSAYRLWPASTTLTARRQLSWPVGAGIVVVDVAAVCFLSVVSFVGRAGVKSRTPKGLSTGLPCGQVTCPPRPLRQSFFGVRLSVVDRVLGRGDDWPACAERRR